MRIIQITDTHIYSEGNKIGLKHLSNLRCIIDFIESNLDRINADLIMVTGDVSHDGGEASYEKFFKAMSHVADPACGDDGDHDGRIPNDYPGGAGQSGLAGIQGLRVR
ncbi:metallophosphoesterase, partial [Serratia sp. OLBL1]|uniref:metallophosphoesterase n=1 Tax=Serratia sp. OLBL1 TaxID=1914907 RepID=UPI0018EBACD1